MFSNNPHNRRELSRNEDTFWFYVADLFLFCVTSNCFIISPESFTVRRYKVMKCGMNAHRIFSARLLNVFLSLKSVMGSIVGRVSDCMKLSLRFFFKATCGNNARCIYIFMDDECLVLIATTKHGEFHFGQFFFFSPI